jgi:hypothetical protein
MRPKRGSDKMIAQYQTQLPDKKLLQAKLREFYLQNAPDEKGGTEEPNGK